MGILIGILTILLVLLSIFMILIVLMQKGSASGGLGAAMGGGMAESAFGAETSDVLSKTTRNVAIVFFVGTFGLYLAVLWTHGRSTEADQNAMPEFEQNPAGETSAMPAIPGAPSESLEASQAEATDALEEAAQNAEGAATESGEATDAAAE